MGVNTQRGGENLVITRSFFQKSLSDQIRLGGRHELPSVPGGRGLMSEVVQWPDHGTFVRGRK
jgi:hypothetical protein